MTAPFRNALLTLLPVATVSFALAVIPLPGGVALFFWLIAMGITLLTPFGVVLAAGQVVVEVNRDLPPQERSFSAYVKAALRKRQPLLLWAVGVIPLVGLQGSQVALDLAISINAGCLDGCFWPLFMPVPDFEQAGSVLRLIFTAWGIGFLGVSLAAAALGSGLVIWRTKVVHGLTLAVPLVLILTIAVTSWWPSSVYAMLGISTDAEQSRTVARGLAASFALAAPSVGYLILRSAGYLHSRKARAST
jgi:hypothetical protein